MRYQGVYSESAYWFTGEFWPPRRDICRAMIIGIGLDLTEISRVEESIRRFGDRFVRRIFTDAEREYCESKSNTAPHYAARFAAKEACAKALGLGVAGGVRWLDMEVNRDAAGRPSMRLTGKAGELAAELAVANIHLSLTHARDHAAAVVVLEG